MSSSPNRCAPVEVISARTFDETVASLERAIRNAGLIVLMRLDHEGGALSVGLDLPPTLVLVYGHPNGGTPIMQAYPAVALDLPLRVLIRSGSSGETVVAFHPVVEMLAAHGVPEEMARRLAPAQALIIRALQD